MITKRGASRVEYPTKPLRTQRELKNYNKLFVIFVSLPAVRQVCGKQLCQFLASLVLPVQKLFFEHDIPVF